MWIGWAVVVGGKENDRRRRQLEGFNLREEAVFDEFNVIASGHTAGRGIQDAITVFWVIAKKNEFIGAIKSLSSCLGRCR